MADRSVVYRLIADASKFKSEMAAAGQSTQKAAAQMDGATAKTSKLSGGMDMLGISAATAAGAIGAKVIMSAANFEQGMSRVQAATHETAANMALMEQAALDAGASTAFSATEAAAGIENLAKAGVSVQDILDGGLAGALDLAAAGNLDVATAAEIAATAMTQFKLSGEDIPHVADLLAAGAGKAQGEVTDLGMALKQSGLVAGQMGLSIEETTGTLAAFAAAGLLGSDAGTSFRTMLLRMANPSKESAKLMRELGISAYDANGNLVSMSSLAGQLQGAFEGQSQATRDAAMATIFGSDAIRAANVLYNNGSEGINEWTAAVDDSGYAAETAAIQMDNLKGKWEEFSGALETTMIGQGDDSLGPLGLLLTTGTEVLNLFNDLQSATDGWATRLAGGPIAVGAKVFGDFKDALGLGGEEAEKTAESLDDTASATSALSTVTDTVVADLEAEAKALEEAHKAASETATSFFNLGDSLDDAKVSLGDWIKDMEEQAAALRDFRINAQKAAKEGLDDGLIRALNEAGPAGALRMKQLANATEGEIKRANKAWRGGQREINSYVDATAKVPGEVSTTLKVVDLATMKARAIQQELASIDRSIDVYVNIRRPNAGGMGPQLRASGGYIAGPGTATSDSIPAYLSNGEYVIKAAAVQKYGTHMFDSLNAMRFASGGKVGDRDRGDDRDGRNWEKTVRRLERALDDLGERVSAATDVQQGWLDKMSETGAASVAGFNTGLFATEEVPGSENVWEKGAQGPQTTGGWLANLTKDIAGLQERGALQSQLASAGLGGDALAAVLAQGSNADLASILSSGSAAQVNALFEQRAALSASVSADAGNLAYGAEANAAAVEVRILNGKVDALTKQLKFAEKKAKQDADKRSDRNAEKVAGGVNGAAKTGHRNKQRNRRGGRS